MTDDRRALGMAGEALAREYLIGKGHEVLATNYRAPFGELDLVTRDGETIVFVEVRTKRHAVFGHPLATVNRPKQRRLIRLAELFLAERYGSSAVPCRFDVVGIITDGHSVPEVVHIENAFPAL